MSRTNKLAKTLLAVVAVLVIQVQLAWADDTAPPAARLPMTHTAMTSNELVSALREGHVKVFGTVPSHNRLAMAWGQVAFENGRGKWTFNHNLGNVSAYNKDQPTYFNNGDKHVYRHFETNVDGAAAYWEVLKHCRGLLVQFDSGEPDLAAEQLKRCGYFEAPLESYTKGFKSLYYEAIRKIIPGEERERQEQERHERQRAAEAERSAMSTTTNPVCDGGVD